MPKHFIRFSQLHGRGRKQSGSEADLRQPCQWYSQNQQKYFYYSYYCYCYFVFHQLYPITVNLDSGIMGLKSWGRRQVVAIF